jgi:uncharacterized protein (TIGR02453 family)
MQNKQTNNMSYFTPEFELFFAELSQNNHKEWFDANKKRYEEHVKQPFKKLMQEVLNRIQEADPSIRLKVEDTIFRINRDVRFSKDKTPYKTHVAAAVARGGKKDFQSAGFYVHFGHQDVSIGGGAYSPDKEAVLKIRREIQSNMEGFEAIVKDETFVRTYGRVQGEALKSLPAEFKEDAVHQPLLAHKQFYYMHESKDTSWIYSEEVVERIMEYYWAGRPLNDFLNEALSY